MRLPSTRTVFKVLAFASEIADKFPAADAPWYEKVTKGLAILNAAQKTWIGPSSRATDVFGGNLAEVHSEPFVRLFWGTDLHRSFHVRRYPAGDYLEFLVATDDDGHTLVFQEHRWGRAEISATFYRSEGLNLAPMLERLWRCYPAGLYLSTEPNAQGTGNEITFTAAPPIGSTLLTTVGRRRIEQVTARHRRIVEAGRRRTYIALGPPGTGKTSLVQRLSQTFGGRLLLIDATALPTFGLRALTVLLDALEPRFLLIDDFDRAPIADAQARVLYLFQHLRHTGSGMTVFITTNDPTKLDAAIFRSERVDEPVEFFLPDAEERRELVALVDPALDVEHIVAETEGFNHIDLTDLCTCALVEPLEHVLMVKRRLRELAAAAKGGSGSAVQTQAAGS
jgi:hypothetical protein